MHDAPTVSPRQPTAVKSPQPFATPALAARRFGFDAGERAVLLLLLLSSALISTGLLRVSLVLGNDALAHLMNGWLGNHLKDIGAGYSSYWERGFPVTSRGYHELFGLLEPLCGWRTAHALTIDVILHVWIVGFALLVRALHGRLTVVALFGPATALSWSFFIGLYPFVLSSGLALMAIAFWWSRPSHKRLVDFALVSLMLLLTAAAHPLPAILGGILVLAAERRLAARNLVGLVIAGIPAVIVSLLARMSTSDSGLTGVSLWLPFHERVLDLADRFAGGPLWRGLFPIVVAVAGVAIGVRRPQRVLVVLAAALLLASLALPWQWGGWQFASTRPLPMAFAVLAASLELPRIAQRRALHLAIVGAFVVTALASTVWGVLTLQQIDEDNRPFLTALDSFPRSPAHRITVVVTRPPSPPSIERIAPLLHVGQLAALQLGGSDHYAQDRTPSIHSMLRVPHACDRAVPTKSDMARAMDSNDPSARRELVLALLGTARPHDEVLVLGAPDDQALLESAGFTVVAAQDGVFLLRPR